MMVRTEAQGCKWLASGRSSRSGAAVRERGEGRIVYPTEVKIEEIGLMMVGEKKAER